MVPARRHRTIAHMSQCTDELKSSRSFARPSKQGRFCNNQHCTPFRRAFKRGEGSVRRMRKGASFAGAGAALLCLALLAGCSENDGQSQAPLARIEAVTAKVVDFAPRVTLTGTVSDPKFQSLI